MKSLISSKDAVGLIGLAFRVQALGNAQVRQAHISLISQHQVVGLDIAMDHLGRLPRIVERVGHAQAHGAEGGEDPGAQAERDGQLFALAAELAKVAGGK